MAARRPLTEGINQIGQTDPEAVRRFVAQQPAAAQAEQAESELSIVSNREQASESESKRPHSHRSGPGRVALVPVTVRLRPEIAHALKRASLERQLAGEALYTQQDIVEQVLQPWLRQEGKL